MSITVRLWDDKTLDAIKNRTADNHTLTVFMNVSSFYEHEIKVYPYDIRKEYTVAFKENDGYISTRKFYATDDKSLLWFLSQEFYAESIIRVVAHQRRNVELKF
jgi:hypothetical protein